MLADWAYLAPVLNAAAPGIRKALKPDCCSDRDREPSPSEVTGQAEILAGAVVVLDRPAMELQLAGEGAGLLLAAQLLA